MSSNKDKDYEKVIKEYEHTIQRYNLMVNNFTPQYNRLIESGTSIVKYLFAMNAGAILALLTFVGNEKIPCLFVQLHFTFKLLIGGVITAIGSGCAEYLRQDLSLGIFKKQLNERNLEDQKTSIKLTNLLIISRFLALVSLITFIGAITNALRVLTSACQ